MVLLAVIISGFALVIRVEPGASNSEMLSTRVSSSSNASPPLVFSIQPGVLFATPTAALNYSLLIQRWNKSVSQVVLLATPLVSGVAVNLTPKNFTFHGDIEAVTLGIHVAENQSIRDLPIEVLASTRAGAQSETFRFQLNKALILIDFSGGVIPKRLEVHAGQTVTWMDFSAMSDEVQVLRVRLLNDSTSSPGIFQFDMWSRVFTKAGTYPYQLEGGDFPNQGEVVVVVGSG